MSDELEIDGVPMRTEAYNVSTSTGRHSLPVRRGEDLVVAGRSGYEFVPNKPFEAGFGTLSVWAVGKEEDGSIPGTHLGRQLLTNRHIERLQRFFTRTHRLSTIRAKQPDGSWRRARVQWNEWGDPEMTAGGTRAEWSIGYTIPDVWWEDEALTTQSAVAGSALPKTLDLTSFAGMTGILEDAVLTVAGPITNPKITDEETGAWVKFTGTISNGNTWVVDCAEWTSTANGVSALATTTHSGGYRLLSIPNEYALGDTPRLTLSGTGGGANTNLTVMGRRKWVSG